LVTDIDVEADTAPDPNDDPDDDPEDGEDEDEELMLRITPSCCINATRLTACVAHCLP